MKAPRRLFPRAIERSYLARLRRRLKLAKYLLRERVEAGDDVRQAVVLVKHTLATIGVDRSDLERTARQAGAFTSNCAMREVLTKVEGSRAEKSRLRQVARQDAAEVQAADLLLRVGVVGLPLPKSELDIWAEDNARLITDLTSDTLDAIANEVAEVTSLGRGVRQLAGIIAQRFQIADRRAQTIARDQIGSLNARITQDRHERLGVTHYEWSSSEDERVRPLHAELDGTIRRWDDPHPTEGHPGQAINCRCVALPVLEEPAVPVSDVPISTAPYPPGGIR